MTTAHPPSVHHASRPISTAQTLSLLSAYLLAATTDPSLHPSAHLTEHGPVARSSGPNTGFALHNLRRVEAGLRGENLGDDVAFRRDGGHGSPGTGFVMPDGEVEDDAAGGRDGAGSCAGRGGGGVGGEWQDKAEFEREQEVVRGDVGRRDNAVDAGFEGEGGVVPRVKATWGPADKEARKKAKKDRHQKFKREKAAKRQRERC